MLSSIIGATNVAASTNHLFLSNIVWTPPARSLYRALSLFVVEYIVCLLDC